MSIDPDRDRRLPAKQPKYDDPHLQGLLEQWVGIKTLAGYTRQPLSEMMPGVETYRLLDGQGTPRTDIDYIVDRNKFIIVMRVVSSSTGTPEPMTQPVLRMYIEKCPVPRGHLGGINVHDTEGLARLQLAIVNMRQLPTVAVVNVEGIQAGKLPAQEAISNLMKSALFRKEFICFGTALLDKPEGLVPQYMLNPVHSMLLDLAALQHGKIEVVNNKDNETGLMRALQKANAYKL